VWPEYEDGKMLERDFYIRKKEKKPMVSDTAVAIAAYICGFSTLLIAILLSPGIITYIIPAKELATIMG
jgi:hypothetical protein